MCTRYVDDILLYYAVRYCTSGAVPTVVRHEVQPVHPTRNNGSHSVCWVMQLLNSCCCCCLHIKPFFLLSTRRHQHYIPSVRPDSSSYIARDATCVVTGCGREIRGDNSKQCETAETAANRESRYHFWGFQDFSVSCEDFLQVVFIQRSRRAPNTQTSCFSTRCS